MSAARLRSKALKARAEVHLALVASSPGTTVETHLKAAKAILDEALDKGDASIPDRKRRQFTEARSEP